MRPEVGPPIDASDPKKAHWWCSTESRWAIDEDWTNMYSSLDAQIRRYRFPPYCPVCKMDGGLGSDDPNDACCSVPDAAIQTERQNQMMTNYGN